MIKEIFGIPHEPFKRTKLTLLKQQLEIKEILLIHARQGGLNLVVGEPGTGKSILRNDLEAMAQNNKEFVIACIQRTMHTYPNVLFQLIDALQLTIEKGKSKQMEKALIQEAHRINSQGRKLITIIDEAHLLDLDVLRKLRLLFDEFPKNHNIILFAQSELLNRLSMRVYEDIKSRITFSAKLYPLNSEQMKEYIYREIQEAELPANVFDENAIDLIIRSVDGNLRLCRNLCYGSLAETVYLKQKIATIQMVNRVIIQPHWRSHEELITQGA